MERKLKDLSGKVDALTKAVAEFRRMFAEVDPQQLKMVDENGKIGEGILTRRPFYEVYEMVLEEGFQTTCHAHEDAIEYFIVIKGEIDVFLGESVHRVRESECLRVPANHEHILRAVTKTTILSVAIPKAGI